MNPWPQTWAWLWLLRVTRLFRHLLSGLLSLVNRKRGVDLLTTRRWFISTNHSPLMRTRAIAGPPLWFASLISSRPVFVRRLILILLITFLLLLVLMLRLLRRLTPWRAEQLSIHFIKLSVWRCWELVHLYRCCSDWQISEWLRSSSSASKRRVSGLYHPAWTSQLEQLKTTITGATVSTVPPPALPMPRTHCDLWNRIL